MAKFLKLIPGLKFLVLISLLAVAGLIAVVVGLFEMIIDQNEIDKKISKYAEGKCGVEKKVLNR
jgi:hypothetical protein